MEDKQDEDNGGDKGRVEDPPPSPSLREGSNYLQEMNILTTIENNYEYTSFSKQPNESSNPK